MTYNIKPGQETDTKINDLVIQKHGHIVEFTLEEVEKHTEMLQQSHKELEAKIMLDGTRIRNLQLSNPEIMTLSDEQLNTIHLYWELMQGIKPFEKNLEAVVKQLNDYETEVADIKSQIKELNA